MYHCCLWFLVSLQTKENNCPCQTYAQIRLLSDNIIERNVWGLLQEKNWWIIRMRGLWKSKVISESYFAAVSLYLINPIVRTGAMRRIILFVIVTYLSLRPFTKGIYIVLWIEVTPVLSFSLALVNSMFQSFLYVYDINKETSVPFFIATFQYLGAIIYSSLNSMLFWDR